MRVSSSLQKQTMLVRVSLSQALWFCTIRTAHRGSRGIALIFLGHGARRVEV